VEYLDGHRAALAANTIAANMFAQVDGEGHRTLLLEDVVNHRANRREVKKADGFITSPNGGRRREETTKGWERMGDTHPVEGRINDTGGTQGR